MLSLRRRANVAGATLVLVCGGSLVSTTSAAWAAGTTYYVNNASGSGCSDSGAGTSTAAPWCSFTPANAVTFGPGDQLLLDRGDSWNQQLTLHGSGSSASYATLGAYGTGNRPVISRNSATTDLAVDAEDPSYWNYQDLELANAGAGLRVYYDRLSNNGLNFSDIYAHNMGGFTDSTSNLQCQNTNRVFLPAGIDITGDLPTFSSTDYALQGVSFTGIEGTHNVDTVSLDFCNGVASTAGGRSWQYSGTSLTSDGQDGHTLIRNVTMRQLNLHGDDGDGTSGGCPDGLRLNDVENLLILDSSLDNEGCATSTGTAAVIVQRSANVRFVNNSITNSPNTGSPDQTGVDLEYQNNGDSWQDNYIGGNAGPGIEFLAIHGSDDHSTGHTVTGNMFANNGGSTPGQTGSVFRGGADITPTVTATGNLYNEPSGGFIGLKDGATTAGLTTSANLPVQSQANAAHDFSSTQGTNNWTYEYSTSGGSAWTPLTWDATANRWDASGSTASIDKYETTPAACTSCLVSRTWTAPSAGTVSVRAQALKADTSGGDGVGVQILLNSNLLWGRNAISYADQSGQTAALDNVSVAAGDKLRFAVDDGSSTSSTGDATSFVPSIGFTATAALVNPGFEDPTVASATYQYTPTAAGWTFGTQSGVESNGSDFGAAAAPDGTQAAFLQGGVSGSCMSQSVSGLTIGTSYSFTVSAAERASAGGQTVSATLGSSSLGSFTPGSTSFADVSTGSAAATATSETLQLCGTVTGDHTAFIDNVRQNQPILLQPGFEAPVTATYQYGPIASRGWTFGTQAGIEHNGGGFSAANAPEGVQAAFLQNNTVNGCIQQAVSGWSAGSHTVSFSAAARISPYGGQTLQVFIDGTSGGTFTPSSTSSWTTYTSSAVTLTAGVHTVKICGTVAGDHAAFVDSVSAS